MADPGDRNQRSGLEIAIVGMAARVPGAPDVDAFWQNLRQGVESISRFSERELERAGVDIETQRAPGYVPAKAILEDPEFFDAAFFNYSPKEAEIIDPQQRVFLECAWEALENAGYDASGEDAPIGVYAGTGLNTYLQNNLYPHPHLLAEIGLQAKTGNDKDFAATRVSYKLDLTGPSVSVQTGCSTSLVAVHLACQGLLAGECDLALAGGSSIGVPLKVGYLYEEEGILAPDGHCRAFDEKAAGTLRGDGAGVVVLKRLQDAQEEGDSILAVIKGSAINNDGSAKVGFTAPSVRGQSGAIRKAMAMAEVHPDSISLIEAHGTGTALGDPIEIAALSEAFRARTQRTGFCAIGSAKTNIGHLDAASGVIGLIKAVLALQHREIPPSLHFERPNPELRLRESPFYVSTTLSKWQASDTPRRAGVSSFGMGGTNAHVVLEEAPARADTSESRPWQLLVLSARTRSALEAATQRLTTFLAHTDSSLADIAYTLQAGRAAFNHRRMVVCRDIAEAIQALESLDPKRVATHCCDDRQPSLGFLFPGQGAQHPNMGREIYQAEPVFREHVDDCCSRLQAILGSDLRQLLFPSEDTLDSATRQLKQTANAQPALFVIEYALARLWMSWGVEPEALLGHSIGEYTAACLANVLPLDSALTLVAARGRLMQELPGGSMLAVWCTEEDIKRYLGPRLSVAAVNAPGLCVISGPTDAIDRSEARLSAQNVSTQRLHTSHAFHSEMMDPILNGLAEQVRRTPLSAPTLPCLSNVTGTWLTADDATDPDYWAVHARKTVRFSDGVREMLQEPDRVLLEVGPGRSLSTLAAQHRNTQAPVALTSLPHPDQSESGLASLLHSLGRLWLAGAPIDWSAFSRHERRRRVALPTYPFERRRFWIDPPRAGIASALPRAASSKRAEIADWFYLPSWKRSLLPNRHESADEASRAARWLIFCDDCGLGDALAELLSARRHSVHVVMPGREFSRVGESRYTIDPHCDDDTDRLVDAVFQADTAPHHILHLWGVTAADPNATSDNTESLERDLDLGFYSVLSLARSLARRKGATAAPELAIVTTGVHDVSGDEILCPQKATVLGPCKVIPQEFPGTVCRAIDLQPPRDGAWQQRTLDSLIAECSSEHIDPIVALRHGRRWVQTFEPAPIASSGGPPERLRERGVYLITGGLGRLGLVLAEHLARSVRARLVLVSRSPLPAHDEWDDWLGEHDTADAISQTIRTLRRIEEQGGEVLVESADVSERQQMARAIDRARRRFGAVHGVIHAAASTDDASFRFIDEAGRPDSEQQFRPKLQGLLVLQELLVDQPLDFVVLMSSLASVLGGLKFAAYSAANLFLDSFACQQNATGAVPWISASWDGWQSGREARSTPAIGVDLAAAAASEAEGVEAFDRVLGQRESAHVIVSTSDLRPRVEKWLAQSPTQEPASAPAGEVPPRHVRPALLNPFEGPSNEVQQTIARVWQDVLGIERIGIHDNFFDLGGHSLLGTQIISRLRAEFQVELSLRAFLDAPTVAELALAIGPSSQPARHLLAAVAPRPPGSQDVPLSFGQQRLWFLAQLDPASPAYNNHAALRVRGVVDELALTACIQEIVRRHEILRTSFERVGDQPIQRIAAEASCDPRVIDLREFDREAREAMAHTQARELTLQPFDLTQAPLLRVTLLRLADDEQILLLVMHHIISDGWFLRVFMQELATLYGAYPFERAPSLAPLPIQYADYSLWQREVLQGAALESLLSYWRAQLRDVRILELQTDRPRPPEKTFSGARVAFAIDEATKDGLNALSSQAGATLFMTLLAAFQTLLFRYTGQDDVVVGVPIANRNRSEIEGLLGFFVNNLALRSDLSGDPRFRELLARVREVSLDAYAHEELPFEKLVEALQPARDLSRTPLFQIMFAVHREGIEVEDLDIPGLQISPWGLQAATARYDLEVHLREKSDRIEGSLLYNTDLFDATTIERMASHYGTLLEAAISHPDRRISQLPLLTEAENQRLTIDWNATQTDYPRDATIPATFEAWAERTPDAIALRFDADDPSVDELSYQALNRRANRLAHHLRQLDVGPETRVGLCVERSVDMVVGMLGILKAGGAYVPLDPDDPQPRLAFMLDDTQASVLLTQRHLASRLPAHSAKLVYLDEQRPGPASNAGNVWSEPTQPADNPSATAHAESLAYVMYTSGSTGTPKGVAVPHRAIHRLVCNTNYVDLGPSDRIAQASACSFDAATFEIWGALLNGARLVGVRKEETLSPKTLARCLQERGITTLFLTSALFSRVAREEPGAFGGLHTLMVGGQRVEPGPVRSVLRHRNGPRRLLNGYGPTECTTFAITHEVSNLRDDDTAVPIGRPVANTTAYLLDANRNPVPIGVAAELFIGGDGVARGYWNRPELTSQRFIPDPFARRAGARLYRTGDWAKRRADGTLEFLERRDDQVKLRGFRIELGEIETCLLRHPSIAEAVVQLRQHEPGDDRLVAYVVAAENSVDKTVLSGLDLKNFLRTALPAYMVPTTVVQLAQLPLTPSGKLDRKALPKPDGQREVAEPRVAPRDECERRIAAIWRQLLQLDDVGVRDNFFDLGGHSLLTIQLQSELQRAFGYEVPVVDLLRYATVESLARHLTGESEESAQAKRVDRTRARERGPAGERGAIAIVGLAGRFPGADSIEAFWDNLRSRTESITFSSEQELIDSGVDEGLARDPLYVPARGILESAELFDASFFGYTPRDAELMDPQQRVFLECAWETLECAGYDPQRFEGLIGVYAGSSENTYAANLRARPDLLAAAGGLAATLGSGADFLATRVSYKLDLRGPGVTLQTACSTSLVAVHAACRALLDRECDMALAGGVSIGVPLRAGYRYAEESIGSPDGHCRAFDADAEGTVAGDGVGIVALKRLDDALEAGDTIHAVILGTAINNDGQRKAGYTAPAVDGQAEVIALAHAAAGVDPDEISYVETHGTGTRLGDPIEFAALSKVFGSHERGSGSCTLGALKTNVGHLNAAAGVAGLIKTVLQLQHRELVPTLHYDRPNPAIDFGSGPLRIATELRPWETQDGAPRRAGVSSFGIGGTNAHAVLQEAPKPAGALCDDVPDRPSEAPEQLLLLSAKTPAALDVMARRLAARLRQRSAPQLADVSHTLQLGRAVFEHKRALVCRNRDEAVRMLESDDPQLSLSAAALASAPDGAPLGPHETAAAHRDEIERCCDGLRRGQGERAALLASLGQIWLSGVAIDWSRMHRPGTRRRVPLPAYPFERQRHWIESANSAASAQARAAALRKPDPADWFHMVSWKQSMSPPRLTSQETPTTPAPRCLCLIDGGIGEQVAQNLERAGHSVTRVTPGDRYHKVASDRYSIQPHERADFERLIADLSSAGVPARIGHFWGLAQQPERLDGASTSEERVARTGFSSLLCLAQALGDAALGIDFQLDVVTTSVHDVTGQETCRPENSLVMGPCRVIPQEYPFIAARHIDIDPAELGSSGQRLAELIAAELVSPAKEREVAYRAGRRWARCFEPVRLETVATTDTARLRPGGVYWICGGFGGIGQALARNLAETLNAKLALSGRTALPARADWQRHVGENPAETPVNQRIRDAMALEEAGAEVLALKADISDETEMRAALHAIVERFGRIDGVIHAAGVPAGRAIALQDPADALRVFASKVAGTQVLEKVLSSQKLDFLVLCSSLAALQGGMGQVDYCAANAVLDAFARSHASKTGTFTVSINWTSWNESGMAIETDAPETVRQHRLAHAREIGLSDREGVEAFRRILAHCQAAQVAVSTHDSWCLDAERVRPPRSHPGQLGSGSGPAAAKSAGHTTALAARPDLAQPYCAPGSPTEEILVNIWSDLFGITQVGTRDDFYELGGHSLLAIQIISSIRDRTQTEIALSKLLDLGTIREVASYLDTKRWALADDGGTDCDPRSRDEIEL